LVSNRRFGVYLEYLVISGANQDGLSTVKTASLNRDFLVWEKPAHGQHLHTSLAVPFLDTVNADQEMCWNIAEWSPGLDVISVVRQPAGLSRGSMGGSTLQFASLIEVNANGVRKLGVVGGPSGFHEVFQNHGERILDHRFV
jgi:hypothetical protein